MAIDFTLTDEQKGIQRTAREFAQDVLKPVVADADREPDTQVAFQMMRPAYQQAYKLGYAYGFIPKKYGGPGFLEPRLPDRCRRNWCRRPRF